MIIKNGCTTLRAIEEKDTDILLEMINSPEIEHMTVGMNHVVSSSNQKEWIKTQKNDDKTIRLMIELTNKVTIGMVMLTDIDLHNRTANYGIKTKFNIDGRMKNDVHDAGVGMLNYAFNELNLNRINSYTLDYNVFSLKMQKKLGFVREGIQRQKIFKNGSYHDLIVLGLLANEWKGL